MIRSIIFSILIIVLSATTSFGGWSQTRMDTNNVSYVVSYDEKQHTTFSNLTVYARGVQIAIDKVVDHDDKSVVWTTTFYFGNNIGFAEGERVDMISNTVPQMVLYSSRNYNRGETIISSEFTGDDELASIVDWLESSNNSEIIIVSEYGKRVSVPVRFVNSNTAARCLKDMLR